MADCCEFKLDWYVDNPPLNLDIQINDLDLATNVVLDKVNGEIVPGNALTKVEYVSETKAEIKVALEGMGLDISATTTFRDYAGIIESIDVDNPPWAPKLSAELDAVNGEVIDSDLFAKADKISDTKAAIREAIQNRRVEVPEDISFAEYPQLINDIEETWEKPDDWPDIKKILDEDEDANRIISEGGGAVIGLYVPDITSRWGGLTTLDGATFKWIKSSDDLKLKNSPKNKFKIEFNNPLKLRDGVNAGWFILYFDKSILTNPLFSMESEILIYAAIKVNNLIVQHINNCSYIENLNKYFVNGYASNPFYNTVLLHNRSCMIDYGPNKINYARYDFRSHSGCINKVTLVNPLIMGSNERIMDPLNTRVRFYTGSYVDYTNVTPYNTNADTPCWIEEFWFKGIKSAAKHLSPFIWRECLVYMIENAQDVTGNPQTMTIGTVNLAKLTPAEIQIATDKGWILS